MTARRYTAPFALAHLTPQSTMIMMIGSEDNLNANYAMRAVAAGRPFAL